MRSHPDNPASNQIPAGLNESALAHALQTSGYPLQGVVAGVLLPTFEVLEEWGYIDRDSGTHRSLDLHAFRTEEGPTEEAVRPSLTLLVECKRSSHPYIFFRSVPENQPRHFPRIAGLRSQSVPLEEKGTSRYQDAPVVEVLGLDQQPFIGDGPPRCATFTKGVPSGKAVSLSGSDPFNHIVLPLTKALDHFMALRRPPNKPERLFLGLTLCVSVLDAPMLLVEDPEHPEDPVLVPWVRVIRREANPKGSEAWEAWYRFYTVDMVHVAFLSEYVEKHLSPFYSEFSRRVIEREQVLRFGGEVNSLSDWSWKNVSARPKPK